MTTPPTTVGAMILRAVTARRGCYAGDGDAAVADRIALPVGVIAAYAEVFFHVRPAVTVGATDWLLAEAVGYSPYVELNLPTRC